jgi:endoglucanase
MGDWGSVQGDDLNTRALLAAAIAQDSMVAGMAPVVWDDGGNYILLNRKANPPSWQYPTIVAGIMAGYKAGTMPGATYAQ